MSESRVDSDRVVLAATLLFGVVSVVMYAIVDLTLFRFGMLNSSGRAFAYVALSSSVISLLLACYLAVAGRSRALTTTSISGMGWVMVCMGVIVGAPALGLELAVKLGSFGGTAAALFLIIAGSALLQAERNARQQGDAEKPHTS